MARLFADTVNFMLRPLHVRLMPEWELWALRANNPRLDMFVRLSKKGFKPTHIVDVATLTGAIRVVLGTAGAGVFGNTSDFTKKILGAADRAGELVWELPLWDEIARAN